MPVGLSGNLRDFGIADVFQLIGQQRKTGVLDLRSGTARAQLVFDAGLIVSATPAAGRAADLDPVADRMIRCGLLTRERAEEATAASRASAQNFASAVVERGWVRPEAAETAADLVTRDTIFEVLRWTSGSFDFRAEDVSHDRDRALLLGAEQILMDGLRMVDEWQSFAGQVPSDDSVFERIGSLERLEQLHGPLDPGETERAERVLALVDGRLSARRVIDLAQLGTFDGTRCLADLRRAGAIRALHPDGVRQLRREAAPGEWGRALRAAFATAAPLAALAGVVWWIAEAPAAAPEPARALPIDRPTIASLREAYAARALRHATEAYRLVHGAWPERPEDLARAGLLEPMAAPEGRSYYLAHRPEGTIFLTPER